jgi:HD domain
MDTLTAVLLAALWLAGMGLALALARGAARADREQERGADGETAGAATPGVGAAPGATVRRRGPALSSLVEPQRLGDTGYGGLVLDRLARHACLVLGVERSAIFLHDESDPRVVVPVAAYGTEPELVGSRLAVDEGSVGLVLHTGRPLRREDGAWAPIRWGGVTRGALLAGGPDPSEQIDERRLALLARLAELAAAALQDTSMRGRLEAAMHGGVAALEAALRLANPDAAAHSIEVGALSRGVGELLQLDEPALIELEIAARLFDVGRLAPDARHGDGELGSALIARVPGLEVVAILVRHYGERWDGRGRPDGLAGGRIPLASRVIAACDAYVLLNADPPGGAGLNAAGALARLRTASGSRFDPAVLEVLKEVIERAALRAHA